MFASKVLADSSGLHGVRLTTMELTYPRIIHSEVLTHRRFSRNSASSRAIPITTMLSQIEANPFIPIHWGASQSGMQAYKEVDSLTRAKAISTWMRGRDDALWTARRLQDLGLHKQIVNRIVEPYMWITVIISGTTAGWANFFALRCHEAAEPHIRKIADMARALYIESKPQLLDVGEWHLPLFGFEGDEEVPEGDRPAVSAGRCARVSYLTHDGRRDVQEDLDLYKRLTAADPKHASALEHVAMCCDVESAVKGLNGNFQPGWVQLRKLLPREAVDRMEE